MFLDEMGFGTFFLGVIYNFAILYLAGTELLKAGDSGNGWDVVRDRTSTGLRLEPGVKVGLSPGLDLISGQLLCFSSPPGLGISKAESEGPLEAAYLVSVTLIESLGICAKRLSNQSKLGGASVSDSEPRTTLPGLL